MVETNSILLKDLIRQSLIQFDETNIIWNKYINNENINIDTKHARITFLKDDKKKEFSYEILGYYDNNIWIWSWILPNIENNKLRIVKKLLLYGIELDHSSSTEEYMILKSFFVNSRIKINSIVSLDIHLSLIYNLIKNKILFIYPKKIFLNEDKYIILYYLIKEIK